MIFCLNYFQNNQALLSRWDRKENKFIAGGMFLGRIGYNFVLRDGSLLRKIFENFINGMRLNAG
jgi:hypothetical protein